MKAKKVRITRAALKRKLLEANASTLLSHKFAHSTIDKCSTDKLMASGVVLELTALGGGPFINPILIRDGLSNETIEAIKRDIKRSSDLSLLIKL